MMSTEISPDKINAYKATRYRAGDGPDAFVMRIGQHSPELLSLYEDTGSDCALFITAFNPLGQHRDDAANEAAHQRLEEQLRAVASHLIEGEGADIAWQWPAERSYLALGIDADVAGELGRLFEQDAVVWIGRDGVPQLLLLR